MSRHFIVTVVVGPTCSTCHETVGGRLLSPNTGRAAGL